MQSFLFDFSYVFLSSSVANFAHSSTKVEIEYVFLRFLPMDKEQKISTKVEI